MPRAAATRRPVTFVADSDLSRAYDGTEQSVTTWHSREGDDQGLVSGHQTNVSAENLGTLTVTAAPSNILYVCTQGDGSTWTRGSTSTLTFVYKRSGADEETFSHFTGVEVDGKKLDAKAYDARSGSLVVTLKSSYLQGLSAGTHTLQPRFDDGAAQKASFAVTEKSGTSTGTTGSAGRTGATSIARGAGATGSATPRTGDVSSAWLGWLCALGLAAVALGIVRR